MFFSHAFHRCCPSLTEGHIPQSVQAIQPTEQNEGLPTFEDSPNFTEKESQRDKQAQGTKKESAECFCHRTCPINVC